MNEYQRIYYNWRRLIMHYLAGMVLLILAAELFMMFVLDEFSALHTGAGKYILCYVLIPTGTNLLYLLAGSVLVRLPVLSETVKDYVPLVCMTLFGLTITTVHNYFCVTVCVFLIPVLVSTVYGSRKITQRIALLCAVCLAYSAICPFFDARERDELWVMNVVLGAVFLFSAYLLSLAMIQYMQERNEAFKKKIILQYHLEERLKRDSLTGLYNHAEFYDYLKEQIGYCTGQETLSVCVIDIDDFKQVNDTYGHEKGNVVLTSLAELLMRQADSGEHVCRYGGEEFTIVFLNKNSQECYKKMENIRRELEQSTFLTERQVTISSGIAQYSAGMSVQELFERADCAMYEAKRQGKNRTVLYGKSEMENTDD